MNEKKINSNSSIEKEPIKKEEPKEILSFKSVRKAGERRTFTKEIGKEKPKNEKTTKTEGKEDCIKCLFI
jgi:hypothetical protein